MLESKEIPCSAIMYQIDSMALKDNKKQFDRRNSFLSFSFYRSITDNLISFSNKSTLTFDLRICNKPVKKLSLLGLKGVLFKLYPIKKFFFLFSL